MSLGLFFRLALGGVRKNGRLYFPYIFASSLTIAMFYIICSLATNPTLQTVRGSSTIAFVLILGCIVVGVFSAIFLFYTNSFLIKQRQSEFGLYNILGMGKSHIFILMFIESMMVSALCLLLGLLAGTLFNRLMFLLLLKVIGLTSGAGLQVMFSPIALASTVIIYALIFGLTLINNLRLVRLSNPIELLREAQSGEREPKTNLPAAIVGAVTLALGYYIALSTKDALAALLLFFVAVILVIIGTYCLFSAGSIVLLKLLRRNKLYYYKTNHFISVSSMMYRMRKNAAGLANICILSTMVLVMLSTTISLYVGMEEIFEMRYPHDINMYSYDCTDEQLELQRTATAKVLSEHNQTPQNEVYYTFLSFASIQENSLFRTKPNVNNQITESGNIRALYFISQSDYDRCMGKGTALSENEILIYSNRDSYEFDTLDILGESFSVAEKLTAFPYNGDDAMQMVDSYYIVVQSSEILARLDAAQQSVYGENASRTKLYYACDYDGDLAEAKQIADAIFTEVNDQNCILYNHDLNGQINSRANNREDFVALYAGLFFLGIFLGALFIMATVLIMYYKQISEGYEDKRRYTIMQNVGMSKFEVRRTIGSQILTVFFLPIVTAIIHMGCAFPFITRLMSILNMTNTMLFLQYTIIVILIYAMFYALVYLLTAKTYYKIVAVRS